MATSRKVLMLLENSFIPADRRVWVAATTLRDQGFMVSVICTKGVKTYQEPYSCLEGIHVYRFNLPMATNRYISYMWEYIVAMWMCFILSLRVLYKHGFDVIHAANPPDLFFLIGLFYRLFGKKFIYDQHDLSPEIFGVKFADKSSPFYKLLLFFEWCSYRTASVVFTPNMSVRRFAIERGHVRSDRVFVVRNLPNFDHMKQISPDSELKKGKRYLLVYVGVMDIQDGADNALYALHDLVNKRNRQDILLVMIGDGNDYARLRRLAHELDLDDAIHFTGWAQFEDVLRYLTIADIGLSPEPLNGYNEYCTMVKAMEYMAMKKPIVAFDLPEMRLVMQNAALYARPNLVEDFANKIETLLDDEKLRLNMGKRAHERLEEEIQQGRDKVNFLLGYEVLFSRSFKKQSRMAHMCNWIFSRWSS